MGLAQTNIPMHRRRASLGWNCGVTGGLSAQKAAPPVLEKLRQAADNSKEAKRLGIYRA